MNMIGPYSVEHLKPRQYAVCHQCALKHLSAPGSDEAIEFFARHHNHLGLELIEPDPVLAKLQRILGVDTFARHLNGSFGVERLGVAGYADNADIKQAFGTATALTVTTLNTGTFATSNTAGWQSGAIDNTSNLYDDIWFEPTIAAVNTAPGASKAFFFYAFTLTDSSGTVYTSTGDGAPAGTEGTLTFPDVTTLACVAPSLGSVPYPVQNKILHGGPFSHAACFGGICGPKIAIGMINAANFTLTTTNDINYRGIYYTVT